MYREDELITYLFIDSYEFERLGVKKLQDLEIGIFVYFGDQRLWKCIRLDTLGMV